jgi:multiple sugar transport system ATP-binding protein
MGSEVLLHFTVDAAPVLMDDTRELASDRGSEALQELQEQVSQRKSTFIAKAGAETDARIAERRDVFVDTRKLHFFDAVTGEAIYGERERERLSQGSSSGT